MESKILPAICRHHLLAAYVFTKLSVPLDNLCLLLVLPAAGLTKSAAIRGSARDVVIDERIAVGLDLMSASVPTMLRLLYPNLYVVHDPSGDWGKQQKGSSQ